MNEGKIPTVGQLMQPLMKALKNLGNSGSIDEIYDEVVKIEKYDEDTLAVLHNPDRSNQNEVGNRLAWARTHLKRKGYLVNSSRGIWTLTNKAKQASTDNRELVKYIRSLDKRI